MISSLFRTKAGPIGIDIGARSVKLAQFSQDRTTLIDAAVWELPTPISDGMASSERTSLLTTALKDARRGRAFQGNGAVLCLGRDQLFLQSIRLPKVDANQLDIQVSQEIASRLPFAIAEADIRFLRAADIRQGESFVTEIIAMAVHRPVLDEQLAIIEAAGLAPRAVEIEPTALVRSNVTQSRRDDSARERALYVNFGYSKSLVVIAQAEKILFVKYIDVGGRRLDEAISARLEISLSDAAAMRRHSSDRRRHRQDSEISRSIADATRPVIGEFVKEVSACVRYHSVTFRGEPLTHLIFGGGEASTELLEALSDRLNLKGRLSDPFRNANAPRELNAAAQWDIAAGLALREVA